MIGVAIITEGETEAQRNYLTHQSYKATKSQSHLFIQQLFPTGPVCAQQSGDPKMKENVSTVIRVIPGGGQAGSWTGSSKAMLLPWWWIVPIRGYTGEGLQDDLGESSQTEK